MSDWGFKIPVDGATVNSSDPRDYVLHSGYTSLKVHAQGVWSFSIAPSGSYRPAVTINHGLGYAPRFRVFGAGDINGSLEGDRRYMCNYGSDFVPAGVFARVDSNNLYIDIVTNSSAGTGTLSGYYYIFKDSL